MANRSTTTQRRHQRVLGSCLKMAVKRGYAGRNPVVEMEAEEMPSVHKPPASYFTDAELIRLWSALAVDEVSPV